MSLSSLSGFDVGVKGRGPSGPQTFGGSRGQSVSKAITLNVTSGFIFADNFNRANENLEASANWTLIDGLAGNISVSSNHITCAQTSTADASYNCPNIGSDSMYVELDWNLTSGTPSMFFCGRHQDSNNFIGMRYNGPTNGVQIYKRVAGTFTNLGSHAGSITAGSTLRMEIDGTANTVRGLVNGTQVIAPIDITGVLTGVTKAGLISRTTFTTNWADNFGAGSL